MKKLLFITGALVLTISFSACSGGYTCPTYMKKDTKSNEVLVKTDSEQTVEKI